MPAIVSVITDAVLPRVLHTLTHETGWQPWPAGAEETGEFHTLNLILPSIFPC